MKFSSEILKASRQIDLYPYKKLHALNLGGFRSTFHGSGMEFKDFRVYEPGDDVRHISWTASVKIQRPMVKTFHEEREIEVVFLVDGSGSMLEGASPRLRNVSEMVAAMGLSILAKGDRFSFFLFGSQIKQVPSTRNREGLYRALKMLEHHEPLGMRLDLKEALTRIQKRMMFPSLIVVLSDFLLPLNFEPQLAGLAVRHQTILLQLIDAIDKGRLEQGLYLGYDPENAKEHVLDLKSVSNRRTMELDLLARQNGLKTLAQNTGASYFKIDCSKGPLSDLVSIFRKGKSLRV